MIICLDGSSGRKLRAADAVHASLENCHQWQITTRWVGMVESYEHTDA